MVSDNEYFISRASCPACKSSDSTTLVKTLLNDPVLSEYFVRNYSGFEIENEYLDGGIYQLEVCNNCELVYQKQVPNEFLIDKIYNQWLDAERISEIFEKNRKVQYFVAHAYNLVRVIKHCDSVPSQLRVLDYGMGLGSWCRLARGYGCNVYGTDISQERCEHVQSTGINVIALDEIPRFRFDFIHAAQVFEHLVNPLETLVGLKNALEPEGVIQISVPDGWDIRRRLQLWNWTLPDDSPDSLMAVSPFEHINCFNNHSLEVMAEEAGLVPVNLREPKVTGVRALAGKSYRMVRRIGKTKRKGTNLFFTKMTQLQK